MKALCSIIQRLLHGILIISIITIAGTACTPSNKQAPQPTDEQTVTEFRFRHEHCGTPASAKALIEELGLGWNLGNSFEGFDENGVAGEAFWGNQPVTQATFDSVRRLGFRSIRIPITWMGHIGPKPEYKIDEAWMDRIAEVIDYAERDSLYTIINIHHDGADAIHWLNIKAAAADSLANDSIMAQFEAVWRQIAERFKSKSDFLIFEACNEIHDGSWGWGSNLTDGGRQYALLNEWMQRFVNTVRATGGNNKHRYLAVAGYCMDPERTCDHMVLPKDPTPNRLLVTAHFYSPAEFTLQDLASQWGHTADSARAATWCTEAYVERIFNQLKTTYIDRGIPLYIGEAGCIHRNDTLSEAFRKYYLEYVFKCAADRGMAAFFWDNGAEGSGVECSGLINHATGQLIGNADEIIEVMKRAVYDKSEKYTLRSIYNRAPRPQNN